MSARLARIFIAAIPHVVLLAMPATAGDQTWARGRAIAEVKCARCHAIGAKGESPMALAPPFRALPERYPVEHLAEALAEGIVVGHPAMPEFTFAPADIDALLTYLQGLAPDKRSPSPKG
jgi:mono/diheme cytochrome c family protein